MPRGLRAGDCSERGRTQPRWNTRPCAQSQAHLGAVGAVTPEEPGRQPCARSPSQREVSIPVYGGSGSPRPDTCDTRSLSLVTKEPHTRQGHHRVFSSSLTSPGLGTCRALMSFPDQRGLASFLLGAELQTGLNYYSLYAGQEATVRTGHETTDWFQIGKGVRQSCILSPCLFNCYAEYIMRNAGLEETQAGIKIVGKISITSDMQMIPPLWQKVKRT